jgi:hypothetical protein
MQLAQGGAAPHAAAPGGAPAGAQPRLSGLVCVIMSICGAMIHAAGAFVDDAPRGSAPRGCRTSMRPQEAAAAVAARRCGRRGARERTRGAQHSAPGERPHGGPRAQVSPAWRQMWPPPAAMPGAPGGCAPSAPLAASAARCTVWRTSTRPRPCGIAAARREHGLLPAAQARQRRGQQGARVAAAAAATVCIIRAIAARSSCLTPARLRHRRRS